MFGKTVSLLALILGTAQAEEVIASNPNKPLTDDSQMNPKGMGPMRGIMEGQNCCYARSCSDACGAAMEFEFLWWLAENHGFSVAYQQKNATFSDSTNENSGSILRIHPEWDAGFRFGIGYNSRYDRWDLFANWTWYTNHSVKNNTLTGSGPLGYYPMNPDRSSDSSIVDYGAFQAGWHFWYNSFDLELGRAFYITQQLSLRPSLGARGAWLRQKFYSNFTDPIASVADFGPFTQDRFHGKSDFLGLGPRLSLNADYHIGMGFSLIGRSSAALLYGQSSVRYFEETQLDADDAFMGQVNFTDQFHQLTPTGQLYLGFGWEKCLKRNQVFLGLDFGWEANYYGNQYQIPTVLNTRVSPLQTEGNQPITMEGLTVNAHADF